MISQHQKTKDLEKEKKYHLIMVCLQCDLMHILPTGTPKDMHLKESIVLKGVPNN